MAWRRSLPRQRLRQEVETRCGALAPQNTEASHYVRSLSLVASQAINDFGLRKVQWKHRNLHPQATATWPLIISSYIAPDSD